MRQRNAAQAAGTSARYIKVTWSDDGRHEVEIRGFRLREDVRRLVRALERHIRMCRVRGLPIDTAETQRGVDVSDDEALHEAAGR